jgi:glycosyltransferase involved in cell wall biosynthesis
MIGIDARLLAYRTGGISTYIRQMTLALAKFAPQDAIGIFNHQKDAHQLSVPFRSYRLFTPPHHRIERVALSAELLHHRLKIWHSPDFIPPYRGGKAHVITVHDLTFLHYPQHKDAGAVRYYNGQIVEAVRHADHILSVSEATKHDLITMLNVPEAKITVQPNGIDSGFVPLSADEKTAWRRRLKLPTDFILFVGTLEPRKNIPALLNAYETMSNPPPLVLVGRMGWLFEETLAKIHHMQAQGKQIILRDDIDDVALPAVYACASVLVLPSLYEGFGLPALEAMACGTPVVVSNNSSLPEVVGDVGLLINPQEPETIRMALERALSDSEWRSSAIPNGIARAKLFTWGNSAKIAWSVYQNML